MIHVIKKSRLEEIGQTRSTAVRILGGFLLLTIAILGAAFAAETRDSRPAETVIADEFAYVEVLPLEMVAEISKIDDDRPLIDRISIEMISNIPLEPMIVYSINKDREPTLDQD